MPQTDRLRIRWAQSIERWECTPDSNEAYIFSDTDENVLLESTSDESSNHCSESSRDEEDLMGEEGELELEELEDTKDYQARSFWQEPFNILPAVQFEGPVPQHNQWNLYLARRKFGAQSQKSLKCSHCNKKVNKGLSHTRNRCQNQCKFKGCQRPQCLEGNQDKLEERQCSHCTNSHGTLTCKHRNCNDDECTTCNLFF
ncbi:hypothetical protein BDR26DRAFT_1006051, partial [Obelidium mucronatum]